MWILQFRIVLKFYASAKDFAYKKAFRVDANRLVTAVLLEGNRRFLFHSAETVVGLYYRGEETPFQLQQIYYCGESIYAHPYEYMQVAVPPFLPKSTPPFTNRKILVQHEQVIAVIEEKFPW